VSQPLQLDFHLSKEDLIEHLHLSKRSNNALRRSGIRTIGEVTDLVKSGMIANIRGLGKKCILEIEDRLVNTKIGGGQNIESNANTILGLGRLQLAKRARNALRNAGIQTIPEVVHLVESGEIRKIRGLGKKSILNIQERLASVEIDYSSKVGVNPDRIQSSMNVDEIPDSVINWQSSLITKQLSAELLHKNAIVADRSVKDWLTETETCTNSEVYQVLATILSSSLNICEELEYLIDSVSAQHSITLLLSRYGFEVKTLTQIGKEMGISRERVRQIDNEFKNKLNNKVSGIVDANSIRDLKGAPSLIRIQSALLIARDIGLDVNYEGWTECIRSSGLVGNWKSQDVASKDVVEVMIAICNMLVEYNIPYLQIPKCLQYSLQLTNAGLPNVPAKILHACKRLPNKDKRLINRHTKHSGGVYAKWLSQELSIRIEETKDILQGLGYKMLCNDWFIPKEMKDSHLITKNDVFHNGIRKMFSYCGPMSIDDMCSGLRHVLSRTKFPVPPPDVMKEIARIHDYKCDEGMYYWDGNYDANLNASETIIINCLDRIGPVVHHSELVHAFIKSNQSISALSATLNNSPLFEKIEIALYKVRGRSISYHDIERAKVSRDRQFLNPEVEYKTDGNVIVSFTVSAIVIGLGTVSCDNFPNLSGEDWNCYVQGERVGRLYVTENEFRHLKIPFKLLNCQPGNRLMLIFNTWNRTVTIEKVGTDA